jgi:hypothetical protein
LLLVWPGLSPAAPARRGPFAFGAAVLNVRQLQDQKQKQCGISAGCDRGSYKGPGILSPQL